MDTSVFVLLMPASTISRQAVLFPFSPEHSPERGVFGAGLIGRIVPGTSNVRAIDAESGDVHGDGGGVVDFLWCNGSWLRGDLEGELLAFCFSRSVAE